MKPTEFWKSNPSSKKLSTSNSARRRFWIVNQKFSLGSSSREMTEAYTFQQWRTEFMKNFPMLQPIKSRESWKNFSFASKTQNSFLITLETKQKKSWFLRLEMQLWITKDTRTARKLSSTIDKIMSVILSSNIGLTCHCEKKEKI